MIDFRAPQREIMWFALDIEEIHKRPYHPTNIDPEDLDPEINPVEIWRVHYREECGLLQPKLLIRDFETEVDAENFFTAFCDGGYVLDLPLAKIQSADDPIFFREVIDGGRWSEYWSRGCILGEPVSTATAGGVLHEVGVIDYDEDGASKVCDSVLQIMGEDRIREAKDKFPESWQHLIIMEYCGNAFSENSPAYIAAAARYCEHVTGEIMLAGYLTRDLEILCRGTEAIYWSSVERNNNRDAAKKTGDIDRMRGRWNTLIATMEEILANPVKWKLKRTAQLEDLAKMSAWHLRYKKKSAFWRVGGVSSVANYLASIGAGEGGGDLKERLLAIKKSLKLYQNQMVRGRST